MAKELDVLKTATSADKCHQFLTPEAILISQLPMNTSVTICFSQVVFENWHIVFSYARPE